MHVEKDSEGALDCVKDQLFYAICVEGDAEDYVEHRQIDVGVRFIVNIRYKRSYDSACAL